MKRSSHLGAALVVAACAAPMQEATRDRGTPAHTGVAHRPPRPVQCLEVDATTHLQGVLDEASDGLVVCLAPGRHAGPVVLRRPATLWGDGRAVVTTSGVGTTISVEAAGSALLGLVVDGSGTRYDRLDAAVHVVADDVRVEGVLVENAMFGLLIEKVYRATLRHNVVRGPDAGPLGMRGDGIRLWETRDSLIEDNIVVGSRDLVVWYSTGNRFAGNTVERSRYGTHFMYSHDNVVERGRFVDDVVGIFVMYSRNVTVRECLLARAGGAGGIGLGVKESGNLVVLDNRFVLDHVGVYVDTSPLDASEPNRFERNEFRLSQTAMVFHASPRWNTLVDNVFADNQSQVRVEGGGDALAVRWQGNDFDDYVGYDLDGDGFGDVPYQLRSLSGDLVSRFPVLEFHRGSLTLALIDAVSHLFPLFRPRTVLVDPRPRMAPTTARHGS